MKTEHCLDCKKLLRVNKGAIELASAMYKVVNGVISEDTFEGFCCNDCLKKRSKA